ncbi:MAG: HAD-IA family hydrolase [Oscillospiraceae bacterium]|nr:HAD-IA family hydrolase [Oscillospiraceae bacterium]
MEKTCEKFDVEFSREHLIEAFESAPIDKKMLEYAIQFKTDYTVGIITDNSVARVDTIMLKNNWSDIFELVIVSEEAKCTKKGTEIFEISAQRANVKPEECIFIDNKQKNVDSAIKAGFYGVYFDDEVRDYDSLFKSIEEIISSRL